MFSASQLNQATIFGLGIMPYISASIIFQLLGSVYPPLEAAAEGRRKRPQENQRIHPLRHRRAVPRPKLGLPGLSDPAATWCYDTFLVDGSLSFGWQLVTRDDHDRRHDLPDVARRADRRVRHRQRHQPDDHGRHSGPHARRRLRTDQADDRRRLRAGRRPRQDRRGNPDLVLAVLFVAVVVGVVFITQGQRRIPTQSAKHVRGRRVYGGTRQYLPLRVNQAGVMPIIFASSLLMFPSLLFSWLCQRYPNSTLLGDIARRCSRAARRSSTTCCTSS